MAHRETTGGLVPMAKISNDLKENYNDIETSLKKLRKLGSGYQVTYFLD
jgi:hypothetical protein